MSKMPAKKKSCFQITSVTQAQVAASSITDDTESLDDPDESRTEDVSSEIFDVSRATDFEPEGVCDRSSSEETLNNVGETEASAVVAPHIPQDGQLLAGSGSPNGGHPLRSTVLAGVVHGNPQVLGTGLAAATAAAQPPPAAAGNVQQQTGPAGAGGAVNAASVTSQPAPAAVAASTTTTTTTTCSSRFRVIKLDHGTGEPFRRGRWTCMEFYERDSEGSIITRTVDSIKHPTLDHNTDRDSGLGATGGSVVAPTAHSVLGLDSMADGSFAPHPQQTDPQSYNMGHQTFQPPGYSPQVMAGPAQQVAQGGMQPTAPQNILPHGHNGLSMPSLQTMPLQQVQKSPSLAPQVTQPPQFAYTTQAHQLGPSHHLSSQGSLVPGTQGDYRQQQHLPVIHPQPGGLPGATTQGLPVASLPVAQPLSQGPSPVMTPAASGVAPVLGLQGQSADSAGQGAVGLPGGQTSLQQSCTGGGGAAQQGVGSVPGVAQPLGVGGGGGPVSGGPSSPHTVAPGVQNMPAVVSSTGITSGSTSVPTAVPSTSSTPISMPNALSAIGQSQVPQGTNIGAQTGGLVMQGGAAPPPTFNQFPAQATISQVDENRRKSDALPQPPATSGKDLMKPLIPEPLQLSAATPMNSLTTTMFGIPIPLDGDEDSSSGASVVAIDNKIEQAMDLVKSHLMYAVREEVEVLKEQIKELYERNSVLERENALLKSLANNDQLSQLSVQLTNPSSTSPQQPTLSAAPSEGSQPPSLQQQPNVSSA
ncbi:TSC22 domain family protein 2 [Amia ocellicauda]|uniref:TSC22 domain family protein 2 n=1 Tax=Amia ocellicauda TaxID=2972642 RepID=UPI0034645191